MGFKEFIFDLLGNKKEVNHHVNVDVCCQELSEKIVIRDLAINSAVNIIGNSLALSHFNTYRNGKQYKGNDYYVFNIQPNQNYSATRFWKKFVHKLVYDNECLVIRQDDGYFIADSFTIESRVFYPSYYKNIIVDGYNLRKGYTEAEVLYFKLNERKITNVIDVLYQDYGKLVEYSKTSYKKNNAKRGIVNIPTNYPKTQDAQEKLNKLLNEHIQKFYNAENGAVLPLTSGITYEDISSDSYKNATDSRDIRNLIDDIFDFTAIGFQIPPQLLRGSANDLESTVDRFIKFSIEPFCEMIEDEMNRKLYSKSDYLNNTYVSIDTSRLKATNLSSLANVIDILSRNGVNNIDENRELLGKEPLRTEESQKRRITKNYEASEDI